MKHLTFVNAVTNRTEVIPFSAISGLSQSGDLTVVSLKAGACHVTKDPDFETLNAQFAPNKTAEPIPFTTYVGADDDGWLPTPVLKWFKVENTRPTAREEAIAAKVLEEANPRENITGHYPWGPEQQWVLRVLWKRGDEEDWRDVPRHGAEELYTTTEDGLPIPNAIAEPGVVVGDLEEKLRETLGGD